MKKVSSCFLLFAVLACSPVFSQDNKERTHDRRIHFPENFVIKAGYQYTGSNYVDAGIALVKGAGWYKDFPQIFHGVNLGCAFALNRSENDPSEQFIAPRIGYEMHGVRIPIMARLDASYYMLKRRGTAVVTPSAGLSLAGGILYVAYGYNFPFEKSSVASELRGNILSAGVHIPLILFRMF